MSDIRRNILAVRAELAAALDLMRSPSNRKEAKLSTAFSIVRLHGVMTTLVYRLRQTAAPNDQFAKSSEEFLGTVSQDLLMRIARPLRANSSWLKRYRTIWREEFSLFLFCFVLFAVSLLVGWIFAVTKPEYSSLFIPQELLEMITDQHAWFERIQKNPLLYVVQIGWNNIRVCLIAFAFGAIFGLGGLGIVTFNGIFFGVLLGYCHTHNFIEPLVRFVLGHAFLELSIIIAAGFASLLYGQAFFTRPYTHFRKRLGAGSRRALLVLAGITPWLILAASIESLISPFNFFAPAMKLLIGVIAGAAFWIWTFWPDSGQSNRTYQG